MPSPLLELNAISRTYTSGGEPLTVLREVSLTIQSGEFVAIMGASGSGKSTLMNIIGCLDKPTTGTYRIRGVEVASLNGDALAALRRDTFGFIFQRYNLMSDLTAVENAEVPAVYCGMAKTERAAHASDLLRELGLGDRLEHQPNQLSGGQQQRVALGRAVVAETAVCLMDEPLSNLDAQLRGDMRREIRALQRRLGITMLYVTHDQVEAMTMADRVILMRAGHIEQNGTPASLYEQPETVFAARFIGAPAMNLLPAGMLAKCPELLAGMPAGHAPEALIAGVRPESVALAQAGLQARIIAAEYLGADTQVETRVGEETVIVRRSGRFAAPAGANIYLKWRPQDAHWFEASSHRRIAGK